MWKKLGKNPARMFHQIDEALSSQACPIPAMDWKNLKADDAALLAEKGVLAPPGFNAQEDPKTLIRRRTRERKRMNRLLRAAGAQLSQNMHVWRRIDADSGAELMRPSDGQENSSSMNAPSACPLWSDSSRSLLISFNSAPELINEVMDDLSCKSFGSLNMESDLASLPERPSDMEEQSAKSSDRQSVLSTSLTAAADVEAGTVDDCPLRLSSEEEMGKISAAMSLPSRSCIVDCE